MLRTFLQISAIILTLEAAWFLLRGDVGISVAQIAQLASTKWDYNSDVVVSLSKQKANSWVGLLVLLLAFVIQLSNSLWPMRWADFSVDRNGVWCSVIFGAIVLFFGNVTATRKASNISDNALMLLSAEQSVNP